MNVKIRKLNFQHPWLVGHGTPMGLTGSNAVRTQWGDPDITARFCYR